MKLYIHPVSMTSRPVRLFIAESGIDVDEQVVDLMAGEHYQEPFTAINPSRQVPVLQDGDFRLTESSAILKYLADKIDSPAYPKDLKQRAKVNEMMDWFNTTFYRDYAYGWIYPQTPQPTSPPDRQGQSTSPRPTGLAGILVRTFMTGRFLASWRAPRTAHTTASPADPVRESR
jgi:glutathione S-transferase